MTYRKNGDLIVTAGGLSPQSSGGYMMMPGSSFGFSPQWQFVSNPLFWTYNSYENTTSIYTRCLFDSNDLSHKEGFAPINAFDLISIYKKQDIKDLKISLETIFKYDDYFVFAYFDQKNDRYRLFKF